MKILDYIKTEKGEVDEKIRAQLVDIKAHLTEEGIASKEMMRSYFRFIRKEASKEELVRANRQLRSCFKAVVLGILCILPGSLVTLPAIVRMAQKAGIDIFPDSFKEEKTP